MNRELQIRLSAFKWLEEQVKLFGDILSWHSLQKEFVFQDEKIILINQQGIFKPRQFKEIPISITSSPDGPYSDQLSNDGNFIYKYRGNDPNHYENVGLRKAMETHTPLIYFFKIKPGRYLATWPVYIVGDEPKELSFYVETKLSKLNFDVVGDTFSDDKLSNSGEIMKRYSARKVLQRVHQTAFRERVLDAYHEQCAFCRLKHRELLDAAHIIPDSAEEGTAEVSNGLSLCKIHHAAYDRFFIGVSPDYQIFVREDLLSEHDGPMLKYGIQEMHGSKIILPRSDKLKPNRYNLEVRFEEFLNR